MKTSRQFKFRVAAAVVALTAFLMSTELPRGSILEVVQAERPLFKREYARTAPISDKVITVKFTVNDDDYPVEASQLEGGLIRIEELGKAIYGFSPIIGEPVNGIITIKVYQIGKVRSLGKVVGESLNEVHTLVLDKVNDKYFTTYADANASFKIEILDVQTESQKPGEVLTAENYLNVLSECCVTCGGRLSCACRLSTQCGGCCDGSCCR
jgi:hypothetical protein